MINSYKVLKCIIKCKRKNGYTYYEDMYKYLKTDQISLLPFFIEFKEKRYIIQNLDSLQITDLGICEYKKQLPIKLFFRKLSKFFLKYLIEIIISVIVSIITSVIVYHFGWN